MAPEIMKSCLSKPQCIAIQRLLDKSQDPHQKKTNDFVTTLGHISLFLTVSFTGNKIISTEASVICHFFIHFWPRHNYPAAIIYSFQTSKINITLQGINLKLKFCRYKVYSLLSVGYLCVNYSFIKPNGNSSTVKGTNIYFIICTKHYL